MTPFSGELPCLILIAYLFHLKFRVGARDAPLSFRSVFFRVRVWSVVKVENLVIVGNSHGTIVAEACIKQPFSYMEHGYLRNCDLVIFFLMILVLLSLQQEVCSNNLFHSYILLQALRFASHKISNIGYLLVRRKKMLDIQPTCTWYFDIEVLK